MLLGLIAGMVPFVAYAAGDGAPVSPQGTQAIKANVVDSDPSSFTINVKSLANLGANEEAPIFTLYTSARLPDQCADFTDMSIRYWKPGKYVRVFDLSDKAGVIEALNQYHCVVVRNMPSKHNR